MRALCSVWDKTGLEELASGLVGLGWDLVASGGTSAALSQAGIAHMTVEELTGSAEMLGGRVKTLHPFIHGAILADRSKPAHVSDLEQRSIVPIDLVVCNLYPFGKDPSVEMMDIGGPTMVRAAAKNFAHVGVVVDPADYVGILGELQANGKLLPATRVKLARSAFAHTAAYDAAIVSWFDQGGSGGEATELPESIHLTLQRTTSLRYGENPHQKGARYQLAGKPGWWEGSRQLGGLAPSYLNIFDAEAAWQLAWELSRASGKVAAVVVKHANPCGVALRDDAAAACRDAIACDPVSAFGGIVACTSAIDQQAVAELVAGPQLDVVIAPSYDGASVESLLERRRNTRILQGPAPQRPKTDLRAIDGGYLVQGADEISDRSNWKITGAEPTSQLWSDIELAWTVCARTSSNAIVLASNGCAVGIGAGQQNRLDSARIAVEKAAGKSVGAAAASDAFFPFRDGLDVLADAGVKAVVQPGGSVRDAEVTEAALERGMIMIHTSERHFRH